MFLPYFAYCSLFVKTIIFARRLCYLKLSIPPVVVNIRGVNVPCSIFCGSRLSYDMVFGWKSLTSKNADRWCSQNPGARMSSLVLC